MDNGPNVNLFSLEAAENGINQAMRSLLQMQHLTDLQIQTRELCLSELTEFQADELLALRRALEDG